MFQVGDLIIYSGEGVCRVESVGTPDMRGINKEAVGELIHKSIETDT